MLAVVHKFLADRGTHLAAMIAYFALLAFVPLLFLTLSLLALAGEQDESSYLIEQLRHSFPASSVDTLIRVVESALNIVYRRPNRPFVRQKLFVLGLTAAALAILFVALIVSSLGVDLAGDAAIGSQTLAYVYGLAISTTLVVVFTWSIYTLLTNLQLRWRDTLPGALFAALVLQASFQLLPIFVRATSGFAALQAFGGLALLLFWIYLMANVLVFGAEVNWYLGRGRAKAEEEPAGLA